MDSHTVTAEISTQCTFKWNTGEDNMENVKLAFFFLILRMNDRNRFQVEKCITQLLKQPYFPKYLKKSGFVEIL